ncbi:MAG: PIN domain-containing protein [Candidatus Aenigmatarchaeota archaeon]|jgi:rRNA-processing protein FCF1
MTLRILLDTNFLLNMLRYKVDFSIFDNLEEKVDLFISSETLRELKSVANRKTKEGRLALMALKLIESQKIKVVQSLKKVVDEDLLALAKKEGFIVATNDKDLKEKLKKENVRIAYLRNKKKIEVI